MDRNYTETTKYKEFILFRKLETADDNTTPKIVLAINLMRLRYQSGKGQTEVARCLGVNQKNLSQWEQGDVAPSLRYLIALAKFYGVTIDQLLTPPV